MEWTDGQIDTVCNLTEETREYEDHQVPNNLLLLFPP